VAKPLDEFAVPRGQKISALVPADQERGLKTPRIGVIQSGTPNAFAFGHVPGNARVVVTTGLLGASMESLPSLGLRPR
jgi:Zn-dependent protease with chaperone function